MVKTADLLPPSHRRRGATAVLLRCYCGATAVLLRCYCGATAVLLRCYCGATAVLLRCYCGATAVVVRHKPQWHRHDRRGSVVVPVLIAVAPRKNVKISDLRGGTAETLNMFKTSAVPPRLGQSAVGSPRHRHYRRGTAMTAVVPYKDRSSTSITAVRPQYNRRAIAKKVYWRPCGDPVAFLLRLWQCCVARWMGG